MSEVDEMIDPMVRAKRGPGRPPSLPKSEPVGMKKGVKSWSPANVSEVNNKEPGYTYRWIRKDPDNVTKKKMEGWEVVSGVQNPATTAEAGYGRINDGKQLTSAPERSDAILARMPDELVALRQEYYLGETGRRTQGLTAHLKNEMKKEGGGAPVHGSITISSRQGTQVIE